ncbi:MAG TPA: hypothetical protein VIL28_13660 [Steroidobacteraceae bacterium]
MNRHPEKSAFGEPTALPTAQVLPFERQSELQKAVQQRAQETIDRERDRAAAYRPKPLRRAITLLLATIPVFLTFGAAISFIGVLKRFNATVFGTSAPTQTQEAASPAPAPEMPPNSDVVILQPYDVPGAVPREQSSSPGSPTP